MKETKISIFKDLYKSKDVPFQITLEKALDRIKSGKSKSKIDSIRNGKSELKNSLPCILFAGEFSQRNSNSLINHSGLMITDFDKFQSQEVMEEFMQDLKKNKHFVSIFVSPSGNGLKGVVRIPKCDKLQHSKYFKQFQKDYNYEYFDISNSNVDRVCFESYDPNIYLNWDAEEYDPKIIDEGFNVIEKVPILPLSDEHKIADIIMKFNWKKDFVEGERNNYIFDLAGAFCEYGISEYFTENYIQNNVVYGDFSQREVKNAVSSAYKIRSFNIKYFEDYEKIEKIKTDLPKGKEKVIKKHSINEDVYDEIKEVQENEDFWALKEDKNGDIKVSVDVLKYKWFLENNGFKKYFPTGADAPTLVRVISNKVKETSEAKIKDFVLQYLLDNGKTEVYKYCANYQNLFTQSFLLILDTIELMLLKDKHDKSYIAYRNGVLEIGKNEVNLVDYIDIDGYIWEDQIIKRDFIFSDDKENDYKNFINNISNNEPLPIESTIGYLLTTYKSKMNNKCIILNDEVISDNPEGGTGKGLFVQGIKQIRNTAILDGKSFDDTKSFPYQTLSVDTQVLVFDDVKKNFDFEKRFSLVTEGITLERKNKDAIKLSVEESPKMLISTNYAIRGEGNSHDRRRFELEIAQYYGKDKTPYDEFGRELFDSWEEHEFIPYDNYMVYCIQVYLNNGLIKQNAKNLVLRKFIAETSMEFYEWIEERDNMPFGIRNDKQLYFDNFTNEYKDFNKWLTRKKFNIWIKKYANYKGISYNDGISNGQRWFILGDEEETEQTPF
jgi:hypothetical protein